MTFQFSKWLHSLTGNKAHATAPVRATARASEEFKDQLYNALSDCSGVQRVQILCAAASVRGKQSAVLLRADIYQCIARQYGEKVAQERLACLQPGFHSLLQAA
ncbi:MAG: hypothetical protein EON92_20415 [Burkholderiales bacterium]|nr:MAG: hypothetical protein EON92_20415 [Burkholderiales bacterium]